MSTGEHNKDLTRWNRSGLQRFTYVDGNAATFLETLRQAFYDQFQATWGRSRRLAPPFDEQALKEENPDEEWLAQAENSLLVNQYEDVETDDIGWALMRAFARSCHVLARHIDAHANESFLRTATDWEHIRRMVAMLGYAPVGATSAVTWLVIQARGKGVVQKGLQVRHRPVTGDKPVVFETLEDLEVDEAFNAFGVEGGDRSPKKLVDLESPSGSPWPASPKAPVTPKDSVLVVDSDAAENAHAACVEKVTGGRLTLNHQGATAWQGFEAGQARLRTSPRFKRKPWYNGSTIRRSLQPHGFSKGEAVAWRRAGEEGEKSWHFAEVQRADTFGIELSPHTSIQSATYADGSIAYSKVDKDDAWPSWSHTEISSAAEEPQMLKLRRAVKLTGTYTVPAGSEAEKMIGRLDAFTAGQIFSVQPNEMGKLLGDDEDLPAKIEIPTFNAGEIKAGSIASNLLNFIIWLFGKLDFTPGYPIKPQKLVKLAAMLLTEDAKIPSTGRYVYEAFLDIVGGMSTASWDWNQDPPKEPEINPRPLFRFWVKPPDSTETSDSPESEPRKSPYTPDVRQVTGELWYLPKKQTGLGLPDPEVHEFSNTPDGNRFFFNGKPSGINVGDWVAAKFEDDRWYAAKILAKEDPPPDYAAYRPPAFSVTLDLPDDLKPKDGAYPELLELQADYRGESRPEGHDVNAERLEPFFPLTPCPTMLKPGRVMLAVNGGGKAQPVTVSTVDDCVVSFRESIDSGFNQGSLKLYGNVVRAGHGERQPAIQVSSGTGAERRTSLILERTEISTVPDSRLAGGAREDIEVRIQEEEWQAVSHLDESGPADRHYTLAATEQGYLKLQFGDGLHGRALPPGTNNVTVAYRRGAGSYGCVDAGALERLVHPHPLVESVRQPFKATGGQDMERPEAMRENAPASLLALERAVSVGDFEHLAIQHRAISKARAACTTGGAGRFDMVTVVAVMTHGDTISPSTCAEVADYLQRRAVPTVRVKVVPHTPRPVALSVTIRVDSGRYEPDKVRTRVIATLADTFSIENRRIGEPLYLSEVYAAVEAVAGVEDCVCRFRPPPDNDLPAVTAAFDQICFVPDETAIECLEPREYRP